MITHKTISPIDTYNHCKAVIETAANLAKTWTDKPKQRQYLNDTLDMLIKYELNPEVLKENISEKQAKLFQKWLTNLVIQNHKN